MINPKWRPMSTFVITLVLIISMCGCEKSEGIVSSEDALTTITSEVVDLELAHAVKVALASEDILTGARIVVTANDGAVQLSGIVNSQEQHSRAVKITTGVSGVKVVDDKLAIKGE